MAAAAPPSTSGSATGLIAALGQPLQASAPTAIAAPAAAAVQPGMLKTAATVAAVPFDKEKFATDFFQKALDQIAEISHTKPVAYGDLPVVDMDKRTLPEYVVLRGNEKELTKYALLSTDIKTGHAFARGVMTNPEGETVPFLAVRTFMWIIHHRGIAAHFCYTASFCTNTSGHQEVVDLLGGNPEKLAVTTLEGNQELVVEMTELDTTNGKEGQIHLRYKHNAKTLPQFVGALNMHFQGPHRITHDLDTVGPHKPANG